MVPVTEPDKESGMQKTEMTMQELFDFMNSWEVGEFIIHVEFAEGCSDE